MKSKDITNKLTEWRDPMDMMNRGRSGPEMGGGGGAGGYAGGRSDIFGLGGRGGSPQQIDIGLGGTGRGISRSAAKKEFGKEQSRTATMSPAQKQAEKEVRSGQYTPSPAPKKGEAPPAKREEPVLSQPKKDYKELDRPAVQRKAEADKTAKDAAAKDRSSQPHYTMDPKTGKPVPANVQAQLQQKLQGKGFKEPEAGSIRGFKPRSDKGSTDTRAQLQQKLQGKGFKEPAKTEPAKTEPSKDFNPVFPGDRASRPPKEKFDKKSAATSVGLHAALLAALANMDTEPKKSGAEKSQTAPVGQAENPVWIDFVDPGSTVASDEPASKTTDASTTAITQPSTTSGEVKSLPPVVVTAKPEVEPEKKQQVTVVEPERKAEEPTIDNEILTAPESSWQTELEKLKKAEADRANDEKSASTTQSKTKPEEEAEEDVLEKLRKLLGLDKNIEKSQAEPTSEPTTGSAEKKDEPKPEPDNKPADDVGKADAEKGDDTKKGDEPISFPKYKKDDKKELPSETEPKGSDERTRKTDSAVDLGPAATGTDRTTNWAPPPSERKYEPDDRATRWRDQLIRRQREQEVNRQEIPRMTPDVNESLNHILDLANITKKEIVESTMNLDMKTMLALISEASKMADIKGKKHTGKYGKEYDTDEEGNAKEKKAEPAEKNKRGGQEIEATKDAKKWKGASDAGSKIIKGQPGKSSTGKVHTISDKKPSSAPADEEAWLRKEEEREKAAKKAAKAKKNLKDWFDSTEEAILEGAKVDRMEKHIEKTYTGKGRSKEDAENIAWATLNKRGYLDNKNKKKRVKEEKFTSNGKPISKDQYDALRIAAGKNPSPANVKEDEENSFVCVHAKKGKCEVKAKTSYEAAKKAADKWKLKSTAGIDTHRADKPVHVDEAGLKGGQKKLDVAEPKGKLDAKDFAKLRAKKKVKESINFAEMMKETQMSIEEMLEGLQQEIAEFKATGHMGDNLRDALDIHRYKGKDKLMGEAPMMTQPMVEEPVEESPFTYAARQAKASGEDSFSLGGETFPVKEGEEKWIQKAIKHPGALTKKAKAAGMSTQAFAKKHAHDSGTTGKQARLAQTLGKLNDEKVDEGSIEKSGPNDLTGTWSSNPPKKGQPDVPPPVPMDPVFPDAKDINKPEPKKKPVKENFDFSLWDNQLEKMINESLTVTTTQGDDEKDNSVSITASGEKAAEIMSLLRNAGMDSAGVEMPVDAEVVEPEQMLSAYGVPMSSEDNGHSSGMDDMLSLMKKLTGMDSDESDSEEMEFDVIAPDDSEHDSEEQDYEEEDNEDEGEEKDQAEKNSDEEDSSDEEEEIDESYGQADEGSTCNECGMNEGECGHGDMNEGVRAMGMITPTDDGEEYHAAPGYRVKGTFNKGQDKPEMSFVKDKDGLNPSKASDQSELPLQKEPFHGPRSLSTEPEETGFENLESARPIEEELANGADDTTMQDIKYLIKTLAGGLNSEKRDQTTLPHTAVKVTESREMLNEWKKLSGIK